jgi:hypothetical protein
VRSSFNNKRGVIFPVKIGTWKLGTLLMRSVHKSLVVAGCGAFISMLALASSASAQLAPGGTVYNPAVVPPFAPPYTAGGVPAAFNTVVAGPTSFPYDYIPGDNSHAYFGSITSTVYKDGSGHLAFSYKFNDNVPPPNVPVPPNPPDDTLNYDINHVTIGGTVGAWNGVNILSEGADSSGNSTPQGTGAPFPNWANGNPFDIVRANNPGDQGVGVFLSVGGGGTILNRGTAANPLNQSSALVWFTTDATKFVTTAVGLQDSQSTVGGALAYAPVVPEPATIVLAGLAGALGCGLAIRRRK